MKAILRRDELSRTFEIERRRRHRIVFTNGCFDLLHLGHVRLLSQAAAFGDSLVVAINDDGSVRSLKGPGRPVYPASERAETLLALRWVDYVTIFPEETPLATIEQVRPDVLVKGAEYREREIVGAPFVKARGGIVVRVPMRKGHSTRLLVRRMSGGRG